MNVAMILQTCHIEGNVFRHSYLSDSPTQPAKPDSGSSSSDAGSNSGTSDAGSDSGISDAGSGSDSGAGSGSTIPPIVVEPLSGQSGR